MIKSLTVTNELGKELVLELASPEKSGLVIYSISGIGPGSADIKFNQNASSDGDIFSSARFPKRNILIELKYMWAPSIEESRRLSYEMFSPKKKIRLLFETDLRSCYIDGYVEKNEPNIFSDSSGCSISILCPSPFFRSIEDQSTPFYSISSDFEFPFENESLSTPTIQFSSLLMFKKCIVNYKGDADTGIITEMEMINQGSQQVVNPILWNWTKQTFIGIDTTKLQRYLFDQTVQRLKYGDKIVFCTEKGNKHVSFIRDGVEKNILGALMTGSDWLSLQSGEQVYRYDATTGQDYMRVTIRNKVLYEGV